MKNYMRRTLKAAAASTFFILGGVTSIFSYIINNHELKKLELQAGHNISMSAEIQTAINVMSSTVVIMLTACVAKIFDGRDNDPKLSLSQVLVSSLIGSACGFVLGYGSMFAIDHIRPILKGD